MSSQQVVPYTAQYISFALYVFRERPEWYPHGRLAYYPEPDEYGPDKYGPSYYDYENSYQDLMAVLSDHFEKFVNDKKWEYGCNRRHNPDSLFDLFLVDKNDRHLYSASFEMDEDGVRLYYASYEALERLLTELGLIV